MLIKPVIVYGCGANTTEIGSILHQCYNIDSAQEGCEVFTHEIQRDIHYIVAIEDDKIIGLTTWLSHGLPKHGLAELDRIAVHPEHQRKGVATMLFQGLLDLAQKHYQEQQNSLRKLYLLTHTTNKKAQAFYKKLGFVHEATLYNHFYDGLDECVFAYYLTS